MSCQLSEQLRVSEGQLDRCRLADRPPRYSTIRKQSGFLDCQRVVLAISRSPPSAPRSYPAAPPILDLQQLAEERQCRGHCGCSQGLCDRFISSLNVLSGRSDIMHPVVWADQDHQISPHKYWRRGRSRHFNRCVTQCTNGTCRSQLAARCHNIQVRGIQGRTQPRGCAIMNAQLRPSPTPGRHPGTGRHATQVAKDNCVHTSDCVLQHVHKRRACRHLASILPYKAS
jgi:hypothetical protein